MASNHLNWCVVFAIIGTCLSLKEIGVLLKAEYGNEKVTLTCKIDRLGFDVIIKNPQGETFGKCRAPIRSLQEGEHLRQQGECSTPNTVQYLDLNRTIVTIENPYNDTEGNWTCYHGTNRGNDSVYVPSYQLTDKSHPQHPQHQQDNSCNTWTYAIVTFIAGAVITYALKCIDTEYSVCRRVLRGVLQVMHAFSGKDEDEQQGLLRDSVSDQTNENKAKYSKCKTCGKETAFAFCGDCEVFYCETCSKNHMQFKEDHHIVQIKHFQYKHKTKCKGCTEKYPKMVCRKCKNVFCSECIKDCPHSNDSNVVKQLITEPSLIDPIMRTKSDDQSGELCKKYNVSVSSDKLEKTRIRGITFLGSGQFVLADFNAKHLKFYSEHELTFIKHLKMEPRGLTGISRNRVAVTFAYEKKIIIYDVKQLDAHQRDEFNLKDVGKPFQIAYHKKHFVVEVNEGKDGKIVILNDKCEPIHVVPNDDWEFGYFTGNTFRLEFDVDKKEIYIAAIGKKTVFCVDFNGSIKWHVKVPSPRSMAVLPNTQNTTLLVASNRASMIYKLICKNKPNSEEYDIELVQMVDEKQIELPDYMAYDHEKLLLYTEVAKGDVSVYDMVPHKYH